MSNKTFWVSWHQPTEDYRPLKYPPNPKILGWWCSGERGDGCAIIIAMVKAGRESEAKGHIEKDWPEAEDYRFCDEKEDLFVSSRFPLNDWMIERGLKSPNQKERARQS